MENDEPAERPGRFHRAKNPRRIQLTARDLALLRHVARHRFISSARLIALDGGNASNVLARLRALFDHRYLDRPIAQLNHLAVTGPLPMVYGLWPRGAALLREQGEDVPRVDWAENNRRAGIAFIQHTTAVADFMSRVEVGCRGSSRAIELIPEPRILAASPEPTRAAREPLRWTVEGSVGGRSLSVVPDTLFGLAYDAGADRFDTYFIFEMDRGTIPIERAGQDHRSIRHKLQAYYEGWRVQQHIRQLGIPNIRVLFLTNSPTRAEHMRRVQEDVTRGAGSGFFLFGDQQSLGTGCPLEYRWTNGRGEQVRLVD